MLRYCLFFLLMFVVRSEAVDIGIAWEFNQDGDTEGWTTFQSLGDFTASDGMLRATITGDVPQFDGPEMNLSARDYGVMQVRMKVDGAQSAVFYWSGDSTMFGFQKFAVIGDNVFHEYDIPLYQNKFWLGQTRQIRRFTVMGRIGAEIAIDYIRIVRLGVKAQATEFKPLRTVLKQGASIPWMAVIRNAGDQPGTFKSTLHVPAAFSIEAGPEEKEHGILSMGSADTLNWTLRCDQAGDFNLKLSVQAEDDTAIVEYKANVTTDYWRPQQFFLSAWSPPYAWYPPPYEDDVYDYYHKANFDIVLWCAPTDEAVAMVEKFNMKCLLIVTNLVGGDAYLRAEDGLYPPDITDEQLANLDPVIEKYKNNPAVIGYFITDEPKTPAFANLGRVVRYLHEKDPGRLSFINLFPGHGPEYDQYIKDFLDIAKPELLSYDRYTFFKDHDGGDFVSNLATIRKWALRYDVPFCNIIQAIGTDKFNLNWRTPSEAEHRWMVYTSLAYGAKALIWFHWHLDWGVTGSPDREQIYSSLQKVNAEINRIGPYLLNLKSVGAYHSGHVPWGGKPLPNDVLVKSVSPNANLVVGLFKDAEEDDFVMLMNENYSEAVTAHVVLNRQVEELNFFDVESDKWRAVDFENTPAGAEFDMTFRPGGGKLLAVGQTTGVHMEETRTALSHFALEQNYPNPFNNSTQIRYHLSEASQVRLTIFNIRGEVVKTLVNAQQSPGQKKATWRGNDDNGAPASSGVYFYVLQAKEQKRVRKMALVE